MALSRLEDTLGVPYDVWQSRKRDRLASERSASEEPDEPLTEEQQRELDTARYCLAMLSDGVDARRAFETFDEAWDTYNGNLWPARYPGWKARITINKVRSIVHFMQAVMVDNKPRINVEPLVPGSEDSADLLRKISERDWDENDMQDKVALAVIYGIIWGTGILKIWYDPYANDGEGKHMAAPVVPYRIYVNSTATCVADAEYLIHVEQQTLGWIRRHYPDKAAICEEFAGAQLSTVRNSDRDFIREGSEGGGSYIDNAMATQSMSGPNDGGFSTASGTTIVPPSYTKSSNGLGDDTIEVGEFWFLDDAQEDYERAVLDKNGNTVMEPDTDANGLPIREPAGTVVDLSPITFAPYKRTVYKTKMRPKMETAQRRKYPNGRLCVMAGPVLLADIPNPFQTTGFPYAEWKAIDLGTFWGQGVVLPLKDIAIANNRIISQMYDILEKTGNPMLLYKKGSGLNTRTLKNKPGSLIPLDDLADIKPLDMRPMPSGFAELLSILGNSMGEVAGLQDSVRGASPGANTSFATVDQLQESGAAPVRQMVRNMERMLKRAGTLRIQLIQQFDKGRRPIRERVESPHVAVQTSEGEVEVVQPPAKVETKLTTYTAAQLQGVVEYGVEPDSSLATSPAGMFQRYTTMYDKHLIDQQAWLEQIRPNGWRKILKRMQDAAAAAAKGKLEADIAKKKAGMRQPGGKPGPAPSRPPRSGARPAPPANNVGTRLQHNAVR